MEIAIKVCFTCLIMFVISFLGLRFSPTTRNVPCKLDYVFSTLLMLSGVGFIISTFYIIWLY